MNYLVLIYDNDAKNFRIVGIFESKDLAVSVCRTKYHSWIELELNKDLGDIEDNSGMNYGYPLEG